MVRFDPNPPYYRVIIIGILIFLEALLIPLYDVLKTGRWPTSVQIAAFICLGLIQLVTFFIGFLRRGEEQTRRR